VGVVTAKAPSMPFPTRFGPNFASRQVAMMTLPGSPIKMSCISAVAPLPLPLPLPTEGPLDSTWVAGESAAATTLTH